MQTLVAISPILVMLVFFYIFILLPENKRKKKYNSMLEGLKVNDEIITRGGLIGKIVNVQDDYVIVQTGPDKARVKVAKNGISNIMNENSEDKK